LEGGVISYGHLEEEEEGGRAAGGWFIQGGLGFIGEEEGLFKAER
jgi:hypothetical protein